MKEILDFLAEIEKSHQITILYACESGSRSFGTHSKASDYDVRYVYVYPIKEYVKMKQSPDVYTTFTEGMEFHGWDLLKAMKLFQKSNPTLYEWMHSPIVYVNKNDFAKKLQMMINEHYSLQTIGKHYESLIKGNITGVLKRKTSQLKQTKSILQTVKGLLSVNWILKYHSFPPVLYDILIEGSNYSEEQKRKFHELLQMKLQNVQNESLLEELIHFLQTEAEKIQNQLNQLSKKRIDDQVCNELIWSVLGIENEHGGTQR